jgi:serine/threonine protein kinase
LGCTIIELLTGKPPHYEKNQYSAMFVIVHEEMPIPDSFSDELKSFLSRCFVKNLDLEKKSLERRATAEELLTHPWIDKYSNCDVLHEISLLDDNVT